MAPGLPVTPVGSEQPCRGHATRVIPREADLFTQYSVVEPLDGPALPFTIFTSLASRPAEGVALVPPIQCLRSAMPPLISSPPIELRLARDLTDDARATHDIEATVLQLFDAHAPRLRRCVRRYGLPPDVVEDVLQDSFLALFRHLRNRGNSDNLPAWLLHVSIRLASRQRRKIARRQVRELTIEDWPADVVDPLANPESLMLGRQARRQVRAIVQALPARDRQCVWMRVEGVTYREIASALGISLGAVAKAVARAANRLSRVVKE